ncbi:hypothetical protein Y032_0453g1723 [Ancylostoma ceylanicum]|uniref:Uncharacterized protein n=1 Tax=Ancylostoma ceylanicum TaxID=53326 RepID=A0A016WYH5_9BILA|nr:hypothetical protein Y032_0453g1723 [Ancylostoma ceylanicum]
MFIEKKEEVCKANLQEFAAKQTKHAFYYKCLIDDLRKEGVSDQKEAEKGEGVLSKSLNLYCRDRYFL